MPRLASRRSRATLRGVSEPRVHRRSRGGAALAVLLAVVFAAASLAGGTLYRWCIPLARVMETCCCQHHDEQEAATVRRACCETRALDTLPAASTDRSDSLEAPPVAALPAPDPTLRSATLAIHGAAPREPSRGRGPPLARPPPLQRKLALIQVYRC